MGTSGSSLIIRLPWHGLCELNVYIIYKKSIVDSWPFVHSKQPAVCVFVVVCETLLTKFTIACFEENELRTLSFPAKSSVVVVISTLPVLICSAQLMRKDREKLCVRHSPNFLVKQYDSHFASGAHINPADSSNATSCCGFSFPCDMPRAHARLVSIRFRPRMFHLKTVISHFQQMLGSSAKIYNGTKLKWDLRRAGVDIFCVVLHPRRKSHQPRRSEAWTRVHSRINANRILHTTIFKDAAHSEYSFLSFTLRRRWRRRTRIEENHLRCGVQTRNKLNSSPVAAMYCAHFMRKMRIYSLINIVPCGRVSPWQCWRRCRDGISCTPASYLDPTLLFLFALLPLNSIISFFFSSILCPWLRIPFVETNRAHIWQRQWHWYEWAAVVRRS